MKSIVNDPAIKSKPFPKLMKSAAKIVLFTSSGAGTVVALCGTGSIFKVGEHSNSLIMDDFVDFEGSVTLSND